MGLLQADPWSHRLHSWTLGLRSIYPAPSSQDPEFNHPIVIQERLPQPLYLTCLYIWTTAGLPPLASSLITWVRSSPSMHTRSLLATCTLLTCLSNRLKSLQRLKSLMRTKACEYTDPSNYEGDFIFFLIKWLLADSHNSCSHLGLPANPDSYSPGGSTAKLHCILTALPHKGQLPPMLPSWFFLKSL